MSGEDIQFQLGSLSSKMDILLERTDGFGKRITAVENKVWWATGAVAVVTAVLVPKLKALVGLA